MIDVRNSIYSLSDFKRNDPEVTTQLEETGGPVILTVNGKAKYVRGRGVFLKSANRLFDFPS